MENNEFFKAKNSNLLVYLLSELNIINNLKTTYKLKENKNLNKIILSSDKLDKFIEWWNTTIRFEKVVPKTFKEGYLILDNVYSDKNINRDTLRQFVKFINIYKDIKHEEKYTVFKFEDMLDKIKKQGCQTTMYFNFLEDNKLLIITYDNEKGLISKANLEFGNDVKNYEPKIEDIPMNWTYLSTNVMNCINRFNFSILATVLWYIAISGNAKTKYVYEIKKPKNTNINKHIVDVSDNKVISSAIYDLNKIRIKSIDKLNRRKDGWTYSHSFEVHRTLSTL